MYFIGIGDLHLTDNHGKGGLANYLDDPCSFVEREVKSVLDYALKEGITNIFLYGDLCENPEMSNAGIIALINIFRYNKKLKFWVILGNHDKASKNSKEGHSLVTLEHFGFPNVTFVTEECTIIIDDAPVHFMPWPCNKFDKSALNIAHIEVKGSKMDTGRVMDSPDLASTSAVACIGHLHTAHKVKNCHYSGTIYQTNFGESIDKWFHKGEFIDAKDYTIDKIPHYPEYRLYTVIVHSKSDLKSISRNPKHLIKLVIEDGADISVADYSDLVNIVQVKAYKSKNELQAILTEDITEVGASLEIKSSTVFNEWLSVQDINPQLKKKAIRLRKSILQGSS